MYIPDLVKGKTPTRDGDALRSMDVVDVVQIESRAKIKVGLAPERTIADTW